ncbi:MAG: autotransporter assembly complex protein TamA [Pseudomonadota bacterium]
MMKLAKFSFAKSLTIAFLLCVSLSVQANIVAHVSVQVNGVSGKLLNNVRAYLQIANLETDRNYRNYQVRYLHRQAPREIKKALEPFGYYNVDVKSELQNSDDSSDNNRWQATYHITLNQPVTINLNQWRIEGEGQDDPQLKQLIKKSALKAGDVFVHSSYEAQKSALMSRAIQRGYHQASFDQSQVTIDTDNDSADIQVRFDSGPRFYFGQLDIVASHLNHDLLERYARFNRGDPYLTSELSRFQVDLGNSDYFEQVQVSSDWQRGDENNQVPVRVETEANEQTHYRYGIGYGTDTGARITAGIDRRWVNDRGHQFRSTVRLAQYESRATAIYNIPGEKPQTDYYQLRAEIGDKENDSLDTRTYRLKALDVYSYQNWQREYNLSWLREDYSFGEQREVSNVLIPAMEWRYISANDRVNVTNGWRLNLGLKAAADELLSDVDVLSGYAELKSVWSLTERWRLLTRAEIGATYTNQFSELPPTLRFFAGGDNSVRGYAYEQLGPEDETGAVIGGQYLAVASAEVDYRFAESWRVALFTDFGNTMIEPNKALKQSVGFGVRWISPVGAIRLDLAQAIDEPGNPWRLHFTLGPDL